MLDSLHVPLVNDDYDFLVVALVDGRKEVIISLVNKDSLEFREEDIHALDVPVKHVLINTLLGELSWFRVVSS